MEDLVGYGFRATDDELVGYYLHNKILGNTWLVDGAISEVKICSFDPWNLRSVTVQSKIKSKDGVWYFFSLRENKYSSGNRQCRRTSSGFWKLTGEHVDVKDQWGIWCGNPGKIGHKRVLGFHRGRNSKGIKSDWIIHEYHYTLVEEDKRTYVICRLEYKGDDRSILFDNPSPSFVANMTNTAGSVVERSLQGDSGSFNHLSDCDSTNQVQWFGGNSNLQQQFPYLASDEDNSETIRNYLIEEFGDSSVDGRTYMQENSSDYRPKKPVTGVFTDDSNDSDTDSMTCRDSSSCTDTVGSSNEPYQTPIDDIPSLNTIELFRNYEAQEQPEELKLHLMGQEKVINMRKRKCELKMAKDSIKKTSFTNTVKQNPQWIYHLTNVIIGVLLFISIIGWIILIG